MEEEKKITIRPYIKITEQDLQLAEEFFENEKHFNEFLINVFKYYRGQNIQIKTKIVQKYFNSYKKTMNYIIDSYKYGKESVLKRSENQDVKVNTLEGVVEVSFEPSLPTKKKIVNINKEKKKKIPFSQSPFFDKAQFKLRFNKWGVERLRHYYNAAIRYSDEGNKYVKWDSAIEGWADRDELQGKLKFDIGTSAENKTPVVTTLPKKAEKY